MPLPKRGRRPLRPARHLRAGPASVRPLTARHLSFPSPQLTPQHLSPRTAALPPLGISSVHAPQESSKRSWFTNLFSFKAPSATLYSLEDRRPTLLAARALLEALGAACTQEGSINSSAVLLRCRLDEVRDPSGSVVVAKAVRFRVEFQPCNERVGQASGFVTTVALVQEKGALSTFRSVEAKLRREWELDGPKTATLNPRQSLANSPLGGAFVYV